MKLKQIGIDPFIISLLMAIVVAWLFPGIGSDHGGWSPSAVAGWGVGVIFFFYGLRLSGAKFRAGLRNIPLHATIQATTFVLFPILILGVMALVPRAMLDANYYLWAGVFFAATLPSTVSSSVVMVSIARGNIPAAIFNASISSLLGVLLTPLWMSLILTDASGGMALGDVMLKLVIQVIIPIGAGMLLNRRWGEFAERHKRTLRHFDQTVIIAIVYTSFCESFAQGMFRDISWGTLLMLIVGMTALFFVVYLIVMWVCHTIGFSREDRITALFCGSKKSLVHGTVMSKVLVSDHTLVGVLLLPIMIYHAMQLIVVGVIADRMAHSDKIPTTTMHEK